MKYVLRPEDVPAYSPAGHSGTQNHRLVAPSVNGAQYMEVIYGDIEQHEGSVPHAHPGLEQATYVIEGEALVEVDGLTHKVQSGDLLLSRYQGPYETDQALSHIRAALRRGSGEDR